MSCENERLAFESADEKLSVSLTTRADAEQAVATSAAEVEAAQAAVAAAETAYKEALESYDQANLAVSSVASAAYLAYDAYLQCISNPAGPPQVITLAVGEDQ